MALFPLGVTPLPLMHRYLLRVIRSATFLKWNP